MPNKQPLTTKPASLPGVITAFFGHDCLKWDIHLPMDTLPMSPLPTKNISWDYPPLEPSPLEPSPLEGVFSFFSKPAHIRHHSTETTHSISF